MPWINIVKLEGELGNKSELSHLGLQGLFHTPLQIVYGRLFDILKNISHMLKFKLANNLKGLQYHD